MPEKTCRYYKDKKGCGCKGKEPIRDWCQIKRRKVTHSDCDSCKFNPKKNQ